MKKLLMVLVMMPLMALAATEVVNGIEWKSVDGQWFKVNGDEGKYNFFKATVEMVPDP